jgi:hypothetical protein
MHGAQDDRAETNRQLAARGRGKQAKVGSRYIDDGSALVRQDAQTNFPWGLPVWSDALQLSKYRPAEAPEGQVNGSEHGNAPTRKSYMTFRNKEFLASLLPYIYGGEYKDPHGKGYKKIEPLKLGDAPRTIADRPGDASSSIMQNFAIGRGKDENGREYIYFKDNYDLNLFGVRDRQGGASGLRKVEPDWATPGFNPYTIYDRIYLDEIESMFGKDAKKPSRSKGTYGEMMPSVPMWHGSKEMPWWFEMLKPN